MTNQQVRTAIIEDVCKYTKSVAEVTKALNEGKSVAAVLGAGWCVVLDWDSATRLPELTLTFVHSHPELPLPHDQDNLPRFAYLGWKSESTIDNPAVAETASIVSPGQFVTVGEGIKVGIKE